MSQLIRNSARCLACQCEVESTSRHDFVSCKCGDVFVDGGLVYKRHGFKCEDTYRDTSQYEDVDE